jgi:hypothetical protein
MPFIKQRRRELIDKDQYYSLTKEFGEVQPGDRCYFYYKEMVDKWKANPRWTTAHEIYKSMIKESVDDICINKDDLERYIDNITARQLAWQVLFIKYIMPYEDEKEEQNGSI